MQTPTQRRQAAAALYLEGKTTTEIGRELGVTKETTRRWIKMEGVAFRPKAERVRRYSYRRDAFVEPTPNAAYFAGLLMADGNVAHQGRLVQLEVSISDRCLVEALREFLEYTGPIRERARRSGFARRETSFVSLRVCAHDLAEQLAVWGVVPRKTRNGCPGKIVRSAGVEEFFFRGLFDGDGCAHRRKTGRLLVSQCGSPQNVDAFRDWCWRTVREAGSLQRRSQTFHVVNFTGTKAVAVGEALYATEQGFRLTRKEALIRCAV